MENILPTKYAYEAKKKKKKKLCVFRSADRLLFLSPTLNFFYGILEEKYWNTLFCYSM